MSFTDKIIYKLKSINTKTIDEGLFCAREIIEYYIYADKVIVHLENKDELIANIISSQDINNLVAALKKIIKNGELQYKAQTIQMISKLPNIIPLSFFQEQLRLSVTNLKNDSIYLSACIVALNNQGERILSDNSFNIFEVEKNTNDANKYLMKQWATSQVNRIKLLINRTILKVIIFDMAFIEDDENFIHQFTHPDCPFIQIQAMYFLLDNDETIKFITYQDDFSDYMWGICVKKVKSLLELEYEAEKESIYRMYEFKDFPLGVVNYIETSESPGGVISEVKLTINNKPILLLTGEVYEENDGSISIHKDDESILLFLNPVDVEKTKFANNN